MPRVCTTCAFALAATIAAALPVSALAAPPKAPAKSSRPAAPVTDEERLGKAAAAGDTATVAALLARGVPVDARPQKTPTALILAVIANRPAVVRLLLDHHADAGATLTGKSDSNSALMMAANGAANAILGATPPPAPKGYQDDPSAFRRKHPALAGRWDLSLTAWARGYVQIATLLLDHGADANAQTDEGVTALETAASSGDPEIVRLLLAKGARLDLPCRQQGDSHSVTAGFRTLLAATNPGGPDPDMVRLLLSRGASPNADSPADMTPLEHAVMAGDEPLVRVLILTGADVNARDGNGLNALGAAQKFDQPAMAALLRKAGAKDLPPQPPPTVTAETKWARIDVPGFDDTEASGVNAQGDVIGHCRGLDLDIGRGFLLSGGVFTKIAYPGAVDTSADGINDAGDVVGHYLTERVLGGGLLQGVPMHGFLWRKGVFTKVAYPGASETAPSGVNAQGQIVGNYRDAKGTWHFFLLSQGAYTTIDPPGVKGMLYGHAGIGSDGRIVEFYMDEKSRHNFLLSHGTFTPIVTGKAADSLEAYGVNRQGQVVGMLSRDDDSYDDRMAFLWSDGKYVTLAVPGSQSPTLAKGISDQGQVAGVYGGPDDQGHGFVFKP